MRINRWSAAPVALALLLVAGCNGEPIKPQGPLEAIECDRSERYLKVEVAVTRENQPPDAPPDAGLVRAPVKVTMEAWAPESQFTQVRAGGFPLIWMSGEAETQERTAPFRTNVCWPKDVPVAFAVTAEHDALQALDELECTLENGWEVHDWQLFVAWDHVTASAADLMRDSAPLAVQCANYYEPEGYRGPALHQFPPVR